MLIRFYRNLLKRDRIKVKGAAYNRLRELELKYNDKISKN